VGQCRPARRKDVRGLRTGDQFSNLEAPVNTIATAVWDVNALTGATTQGGTSISGINIPALHLGPGGIVAFDNATTETLAHPSGSSQIDVSSANSLAEALDIAAATASDSQPNDLVPANTGVFDWFEYGGNNYIVEAINPSSTPEAQTALTATDAVVEIVGLIDMSGLSFSGHDLTV
jgi:hypothetical protein